MAWICISALLQFIFLLAENAKTHGILRGPKENVNCYFRYFLCAYSIFGAFLTASKCFRIVTSPLDEFVAPHYSLKTVCEVARDGYT
jgi:hypothetical protein